MDNKTCERYCSAPTITGLVNRKTRHKYLIIRTPHAGWAPFDYTGNNDKSGIDSQTLSTLSFQTHLLSRLSMVPGQYKSSEFIIYLNKYPFGLWNLNLITDFLTALFYTIRFITSIEEPAGSLAKFQTEIGHDCLDSSDALRNKHTPILIF